eukprot:SAG11_NODE_32038_length_287_cov_0.377660_1_plen_74_part_10
MRVPLCACAAEENRGFDKKRKRDERDQYSNAVLVKVEPAQRAATLEEEAPKERLARIRGKLRDMQALQRPSELK